MSFCPSTHPKATGTFPPARSMLIAAGLLAMHAAGVADAAADAPAYGLTASVGPVPQRCSGIDLYPTDDVVGAVSRAKPGSTFCLHQGTYLLRAPIIPRSGDAFIGAVDGPAILSGGDAVPTAIRGTYSDATHVRVAGLIIERFSEKGVDARSSAGTNWTLEHNELRHNGWSGAEPAHITRQNYVHHNGVVGLEGGYGSVDMLIENNELAFNNTKRQYSTGDNGGAKFIRTTRLKVLHNYSHDNDGPGLWTDGNNVYTQYAFNRVENNKGGGITHEVSCDARIHNNLLLNNNAESNLWKGGEIYIHSSPNVEIEENEVTTRGNGIVLRDSQRPQDDRIIQQCAAHAKDFRIRNVRVQRNRIQQQGMSGMVAEAPASFSRTRAAFDANRYVVPHLNGRYWEWRGLKHDWAQWRALGHDAAGAAAAAP